MTNQFTRHTFASDFGGGGALAVGEAWDDPRFPGRDEIIYATTAGEFVVVTGTGEAVARQTCNCGPTDKTRILVVHGGAERDRYPGAVELKGNGVRSTVLIPVRSVGFFSRANTPSRSSTICSFALAKPR